MPIAPPAAYTAIALPDRAEYSDAEMRRRSADFRAHMGRRHTVRQFDSRYVDEAVIEDVIAAAALAPSGANHQPWHFVAISDPAMKAQIRTAAEAEEAKFYAGGAGDAWLSALEPIGTDASKPHLEIAPWLIVIFAQRYGVDASGDRFKHYYVPESVGIATGVLITALHTAGLVCLTHTPNPMKFLNALCDRPEAEKPVMILAVGHPAADAEIPAAAKRKKPLADVMTVRRG